MNEMGGTKLFDVSKYKINADTYNSFPIWSTMTRGSALYFSETTAIATSRSPLLADSPVTLEVIMYIAASVYRNVIFGFCDSTTASDGNLLLGTGSSNQLVLFKQAGGTANNIVEAAELGAGWHHIVGVCKGKSITGGLEIWKNGVLTSSGDSDANTIHTEDRIVFGDHCSSSSYFENFNGNLAFGRIYNRALGHSQIEQLYRDNYEMFRPIFDETLLGYAAAGGWTGKINGVTNPAKINGIAVADIAKVNGV